MKLHLGCGQRYLGGYINIDFPPEEHTVREKHPADQFADILSLSYPPGSVEEVRLHHVFEHFTRPVAYALLASWNSWLMPGGVLHIEVPDFGRTALSMLNPLAPLKSRLVAERHIFGSHEAHWAHHLEGYTRWTLRCVIEMFGYRVIGISGNSWKGTYNIEIKAVKERGDSIEAFEQVSRKLLLLHLVDDSEQRLLNQWLSDYREQVKKSFAICRR